MFILFAVSIKSFALTYTVVWMLFEHQFLIGFFSTKPQNKSWGDHTLQHNHYDELSIYELE